MGDGDGGGASPGLPACLPAWWTDLLAKRHDEVCPLRGLQCQEATRRLALLALTLFHRSSMVGPLSVHGFVMQHQVICCASHP
jgi:hypothetical protein